MKILKLKAQLAFSLTLLVGLAMLRLVSPTQVQAGEVLGIHILHPYEIEDAAKLIKTEANSQEWSYVTIPFGTGDIKNLPEWQQFFNRCRELKIVPIIRLVTFAREDAWVVPVRADIVKLAKALSFLTWPSDERIILAFNEPNHVHEWGGHISPEEYSEILVFTLDWFQNDKVQYTVLPAAMDLAAPNGETTMEAFAYWQRMLAAQPEIIDKIDGWNSHSYPNPGFASAPSRTGKNSLRGYEHELKFLTKYTKRELPVYITETGWVQTPTTSRSLISYYQYAAKNIWSDARVKAVTPFLLKGAPGPFEAFSFFDKNGQQTKQFEAYRKVLESQI